MNNTVIKIENLSKLYRLGEVGTGTLSHDLNRFWARVRGKEDPFAKVGHVNDRTKKAEKGEHVWALKDINLEVKQGEVLGIIGKNGAGKSTLLKLLSRVTSPTTGTIKTKGRLASLLEVGTGFHPEMTGRENIFMNGTIMGMNRHEIRAKLDDIVDFAGVAKYLDTPTKRYSSGMTVRLGFAVAAFLEPEILIVDEVLAVGDAEFQKKAIGKMQNISAGDGRTVLFVSHNMGSIKQICNLSLLLEEGKLKNFGPTGNIINKYLNAKEVHDYNCNEKNSALWFKKIYLSDINGKKNNEFYHNQDILINFEIGFNIEKDNHDYSIFCLVQDSQKNRIFSAHSDVIRSNILTLVIKKDFIVRGEYSLVAFIHKPRIEQVDSVTDICGFSVLDNGSLFNNFGNFDYGRVFPPVKWNAYE